MKDLSSLIRALKMNPSKWKKWTKNDLLPCSDFVQNEMGLHVEVFKLEEIESWLPILEDKTGVKFSQKKINATATKNDYKASFGPNERDFIHEFYRSDFENFYPNQG